MKPARPRRAKPRQNSSQIPIRSGNSEQTKTTTYCVKSDGSGGQVIDNNNKDRNNITCSERCSSANEENRQIVSSSRCSSSNDENRKMVYHIRGESDEALFHESSGNEESVVYTSRSDDGEVTTVRQTFKIYGTLEKDDGCGQESLNNKRSSKESLNKHSSKESLLDSDYQGSQDNLCQDHTMDNSYSDEKVTRSVTFEDSGLNSSGKLWIKPNDNIKEELERELGDDEELLREELLRIFDRERLTLGSFFKNKMEDIARDCRQRELDMEEQSRAEIAQIESDMSREKAEMQRVFTEEIAALTRTFNEDRASMEKYHKEQIKELREQLAKDQQEMEMKFAREKVDLQDKLEAEFQAHLETEMNESEMSSLQEIAKIEDKYEAERVEMERRHALELNEAEMNTRKVKDELEMMFTQEKARLDERIKDLEEQLSQERQIRIQLEALLEEEKTNVSSLDNAKRSETEKLISELEGLRVELDEKNRAATEMSKFEEGIRVNGRNGLSGKLREDFDKIIDEHKQELEKKYRLDKEELQKDKERQFMELQEEKKKIQNDVEHEKRKMKEEIDKERRKSEEIVRRNSSEKTGYSMSYSVSQSADQQSNGYRGNETQRGDQYGKYSATEQRQQECTQDKREQSARYANQKDDRRTQYQGGSADYANQENRRDHSTLDDRQPNDRSANSSYSQRDTYTSQDQGQNYQIPDFQCMGEISSSNQDYGSSGDYPNSNQGNTSDYPILDYHLSRDGTNDNSKYGESAGYSNSGQNQNTEYPILDFQLSSDRFNDSPSSSKCVVYPDQMRDQRDDLDFHLSAESTSEQPRQHSSNARRNQAGSPKDRRDTNPNQFFVSVGNENDLRSQINQLRSENEGLKAKIEAMEENISLHKKYKAEAKDELDRLQKTKEELQSKLKTGSQDGDEARRAILKVDKLEKSLRDSEARRKEFEDKIKELNHKLTDAEEKARQAKEKTGDLEDKIRGRSRPSVGEDNRRNYSSKENDKYSRRAPTGEVTAHDSTPLYQDNSRDGFDINNDSHKDRPLHQDRNTGLYGKNDSDRDRSYNNVYGYPEELNQTRVCLESSPGRESSWKQPDSRAEKYSKTSPYSSKCKSSGRHGLSSSPNPLHGSHERLGTSHHKPQETGHKAGRYSSFSAANEPGYNTSSPRKPDGRSYGNDGTPSRHDSSRFTKGNREKAVAERDKLVQLIKELKLKVEELQAEKERVDKEQPKMARARREPIGYSDAKNDLSSSEHADLKSKVEDMQRKIRELAERLKRDSPRNYQSVQHDNYTGNPSMQDIEYIQDKLQRTGEAISHTHENTDPDVLKRIELEVKAIGDLIRKHCEEHGVGGATNYGGGVGGSYGRGGVGVSGGDGVGYGRGGVGFSGGDGAGYGSADVGVNGGYGGADTGGVSTFRSDGADNMKMLQLQMEKQELEMKLNMAKEAMNDYVSRLSEKMECLEESNALSDATLQELYERNAKLKETLRALEKGQKRSMRQNEELRHQTSALQNVIGQICKSGDTSFCSQYSTPRQGGHSCYT